MNLQGRVERLEDRRRANLLRRSAGVEQLTDGELESIIADEYGIDRGAVSDELLEAIVRGEV